MPMTESSEEAWARRVVEIHLGVSLTFVDVDGRVDDLFADTAGRTAAMEVTTLTDGKLKKARDGHQKSQPQYRPTTWLTSCWLVSVTQRDARYKDLLARLEPHLVVLEHAGVTEDVWTLPEQLWSEFLLDNPSAVDAVRALAKAKVEMLMRLPARLCAAAPADGAHVHELQLSMVRGWHAAGSDAALEMVEKFVGTGKDNLRKLRAADRDRGHLFVMLDDDTDGAVSRPFRGGEVAGWEHFQLPERPPVLPAEVNELWVVDEISGAGWHWDGAAWESVSAFRPAGV